MRKKINKYNTKEFFYDTSFKDYKPEVPVLKPKNMRLYRALKIFSIIFAGTTTLVLLLKFDSGEFDVYNIALPLWQWILVLPYVYVSIVA